MEQILNDIDVQDEEKLVAVTNKKRTNEVETSILLQAITSVHLIKNLLKDGVEIMMNMA